MGGKSDVAVVVCLVLFGLVACGGAEKQASERRAQLQALQEMKANLDAKRQEVAELQASVEAGAEEVAEGAEEAAEEAGEAAEEAGEAAEEAGEEVAEAMDPEIQVRLLDDEVAQLSDEFTSQLVEFINADPPIAGQPLNETQLAAIRIKSDEDILVAREYIDKGGDYRRAIDIFTNALQADPDNETLQQELETAERMRYMDEERFAQAKKGMTQDEVKQLLGTVYHRNVRNYPEQNVVAWFYPREDSGASAIWFRKGRDEVYRSYKLDFQSVTSEKGGAS
jgi:tetratricopeptide (TPR) repeat protein